ncbi:hypothetical protein SEA_DEXDERT_64 [Gordonia phage Dexdert]|uniref:Uncharacterized protein n=1 Tax=Gordonia phage Dexdert TaxID=2794946 RepID=A0A7T1NWV7_9CAUD|nr:hypothetical protein J1597_gp64 [Gordonia phage Dexdert]QPO17060.1 hypothetical protein SEA_DEXDERT_64 [Gordonia phage Dexdert]
MSDHNLDRLTCSTSQYDERADTSDKAGKVQVWAAAVCECSNSSNAYLWIEQHTVIGYPDLVLDVLERCGHDALALHQIHRRTHSDA